MSKAKVLAAWFLTGILCFTAFFMFRKNGAEVKVYGSSMAPTIDSGQKVFIDYQKDFQRQSYACDQQGFAQQHVLRR